MRLGDRQLAAFFFAYTGDLKVTGTEPHDVVPSQGPDSPGLVVVVYGSSFIPVHDNGLRCRLEVGTGAYLEVSATYLSNSSLACEVPGSAIQRKWSTRPEAAT